LVEKELRLAVASPRKEAGKGGADRRAFAAADEMLFRGAFVEHCTMPSPLPASLRGEAG
jgi:hypothetical protein